MCGPGGRWTQVQWVGGPEKFTQTQTGTLQRENRKVCVCWPVGRTHVCVGVSRVGLCVCCSTRRCVHADRWTSLEVGVGRAGGGHTRLHTCVYLGRRSGHLSLRSGQLHACECSGTCGWDLCVRARVCPCAGETRVCMHVCVHNRSTDGTTGQPGIQACLPVCPRADGVCAHMRVGRLYACA